jgi:CxxC motif-containing protein
MLNLFLQTPRKLPLALSPAMLISSSSSKIRVHHKSTIRVKSELPLPKSPNHDLIAALELSRLAVKVTAQKGDIVPARPLVYWIPGVFE